MPRPKRSHEDLERDDKAASTTTTTATSTCIIDLTPDLSDDAPIQEPRGKKEKLSCDADEEVKEAKTSSTSSETKFKVDLTEDDADGNDDELNDDAKDDVKAKVEFKNSDLKTSDDASANDDETDGEGDVEEEEEEESKDDDKSDSDDDDDDDDKVYQPQVGKGVKTVKLNRRLKSFQIPSEVEENLYDEDYLKIHRFILSRAFAGIPSYKPLLAQADMVNDYMLNNGLVHVDDVKPLAIHCVSKEHNENRIELLNGVEDAELLYDFMKKHQDKYMPCEYYQACYPTLASLDWISSFEFDLMQKLKALIKAGECNEFEIQQCREMLKRVAGMFPKLHQDLDPEAKEKIYLDDNLKEDFKDDIMPRVKECCNLDKWLEKNKDKLTQEIYEAAKPLSGEFQILHKHLKARRKAKDLFKFMSPL